MRIRVYSLILVSFYVLLVSGLLYTQIFRYEKYRAMSEENRLRVIPLMAPRGTIYDRKERPIVKDDISFNASVIYSQIKDKTALTAVLGRILGLPESEIGESLKKARKQPFTLTVISPDVGIDKAIDIEEVGIEHPGLLLDVLPRRKYLYGKSASNMVGYLGYINRDEFHRLKQYGYRINDLMGRDGVEGYYDDYLRGSYGGKQLEVDNRGREVNVLGFKEPVAGKDIYLSVDIELQRSCDELLEGRRGAIVVMSPKTGAIFAMASSPAYDPSIFIDPDRKKERNAILTNNNYPLLDRAISGAYPPGSVFKMVIASAALDSGKMNDTTTFSCGGVFAMGRGRWKCWKDGGHGPQAVRDALKNSCNVFFYNTGVLSGVDLIEKFADRFGFGRITRIDLPGEVPGILPGAAWKQKFLKEEWYKGDTVNYAIGQGYLLCTPIQIVRMVSVFANGGYLVRPHIVDRIEDVSIASDERTDAGISPRTLAIVREGMWRVVNETGGTGAKAKLEGVAVAGKTGTAQTSRGKNHGWFVGFAPYEDASVAIVVFDEYGGKGGYYAAETAGKVLRKAKELGLL